MLRIYRPLEKDEVKKEIVKIENQKLNIKIVRMLNSEQNNKIELAKEMIMNKGIMESDASSIINRYFKLQEALYVLEETNTVLYTDF